MTGSSIMKLMVAVALFAASTGCHPGFVDINCDAHPRTSQGLGKLVCEFQNLF